MYHGPGLLGVLPVAGAVKKHTAPEQQPPFMADAGARQSRRWRRVGVRACWRATNQLSIRLQSRWLRHCVLAAPAGVSQSKRQPCTGARACWRATSGRCSPLTAGCRSWRKTSTPFARWVQKINKKCLQSEIRMKLDIEQSQQHQRRAAGAGGSTRPKCYLYRNSCRSFERTSTPCTVGFELVQVWAVCALEAC